MSAGRRTWTPTRFESHDKDTGLSMQVNMDGVRWAWRIWREPLAGNIANGHARSSVVAKSEADAALDRVKVTP